METYLIVILVFLGVGILLSLVLTIGFLIWKIKNWESKLLGRSDCDSCADFHDEESQDSGTANPAFGGNSESQSEFGDLHNVDDNGHTSINVECLEEPNQKKHPLPEKCLPPETRIPTVPTTALVPEKCSPPPETRIPTVPRILITSLVPTDLSNLIRDTNPRQVVPVEVISTDTEISQELSDPAIISYCFLQETNPIPRQPEPDALSSSSVRASKRRSQSPTTYQSIIETNPNFELIITTPVTKKRKCYSSNSLRAIGWNHTERTIGLHPQDIFSSPIWSPPSPPLPKKTVLWSSVVKQSLSQQLKPIGQVQPGLENSKTRFLPPLRIVVDATPRTIGGYCVDRNHNRIQYYCVSSRSMPWNLLNQSVAGNATEFEMKNLFCALLLWQPLILHYKSVEIYTDNNAIIGRNQYGSRVRLFLSHLEGCQGVKIVNPDGIYLNRHKFPEDFEDIIGPADALSRRWVDQFLGNVPGCKGMNYESIVFGRVRQKVAYWTKNACRQCGFQIEYTGSFRRR